MGQLTNNDAGFTLTEVFFLLGIVLAVAIVGLIVWHSKNEAVKSVAKTATSSSSSTPAATATNPYAVLPPATVPSKTAECSQTLSYDSNGDPSPLTCSNGDLNVLEWNALATLEPTVMGLGYSPSASQVQAAICNDANAADEDSSVDASNAVEESVYKISSLYYGWSFSSDPSVVLTNGTC